MTLLCYVHFMISTLNNEVSGHYFLDKKTFRLIHNIRDPVQYIKSHRFDNSASLATSPRHHWHPFRLTLSSGIL